MLKKGDLVKYTAKFLRSTGWYTNVPIDGRVLEMSEDGRFVKVQWCDRNAPILVLACNVLPVGMTDYTGV